jgi:hypothetical protein
MKKHGMLKIIFKKRGRPIQMFIATPFRASADEFTVLLQILQRFEIRKSINIEGNATEVLQLRSRVTALGISNVTWEIM